MTEPSRRLAALAAALALCLAVAAAAARAGDPLDDVLARIEAKAKTVRDFRARFTQEKTVYILDAPLRSEGTIAYKAPGKLRFETTRPAPSTLVIDESGLKLHIPKLNQLEVFDFPAKDALGVILPLFGQSTADLRRGYEVTLATATADVHALDLVPRSERVRRAISRIRVEIDRATLLPRRLATEDPNGDTTSTTFTEVNPNVNVEDAEFVLKTPPGTAVKKPLGGLPF